MVAGSKMLPVVFHWLTRSPTMDPASPAQPSQLGQGQKFDLQPMDGLRPSW